MAIGPGRPRIGPARGVQCTITFAPEQLDALKRLALERGYSISLLVRRGANQVLAHPPPRLDDVEYDEAVDLDDATIEARRAEAKAEVRRCTTIMANRRFRRKQQRRPDRTHTPVIVAGEKEIATE